MNKYLLILGQSSQLVQAELKAILSSKNDKIELLEADFALISTDKTSDYLIDILGGAIKIATYQKTVDNIEDLDTDLWYQIIENNLEQEGKNNFAFSLHHDSKQNYILLRNKALELKKILKEKGYKSRLVTGQKADLSSVIVAKNKLLHKELIIIKNQNKYILALTEGVQDFASYGFRDMKRPQRDDKSGMLPPKIARMMINIAGDDRNKNFLDPFCGSGTLLQEAMLLGYKNINGNDISPKAVKDSQENIKWLSEKFDTKANVQIIQSDINNIDQHFQKGSIDLIVSEPFMGDARFIFRQNKAKEIQKIKEELQNLYKSAFEKFKKVLSEQGQIIFVFPIFHVEGRDLPTLDKDIISDLGYTYQLEKDIVYSRPDQKVKRQITYWKLK